MKISQLPREGKNILKQLSLIHSIFWVHVIDTEIIENSSAVRGKVIKPRKWGSCPWYTGIIMGVDICLHFCSVFKAVSSCRQPDSELDFLSSCGERSQRPDYAGPFLLQKLKSKRKEEGLGQRPGALVGCFRGNHRGEAQLQLNSTKQKFFNLGTAATSSTSVMVSALPAAKPQAAHCPTSKNRERGER